MQSNTPRNTRKPARTIHCDWCEIEFTRYPSRIKRTNYCSRKCLAEATSKTKNPEGYRRLTDYTNQSKNMSLINQKLNPTRMTPEIRAKLREAHLNNGEGKTYTKTYGRHTHRVVMEEKLGRKLKSGEIVHHIDGNRRNNHPDNLQLVTRSEHINIHRQQGDLRRKP